MRLNESQLVTAIAGHFSDKGYIVGEEVRTGYGVADLVAFAVNLSRCGRRFKLNQIKALDRAEYFMILETVSEKSTCTPVHLSSIVQRLGVSEKYARYHLLKDLITANYLDQVKPGWYVKRNDFVPIAKEIIAVETKVKDWKMGAVQAKRYQSFANRVYLAIHERFLHNVDRELLGKHAIGLLAVAKNRVREIDPAPKAGPYDSARYNVAAEWLWQNRRRRLKKISVGE